MDARREAQENAGRFSTYMRKQYDQRRREREMSATAKKEEDFSEQIRQNRDKIEAARKEMLDKQREIREAAEGRERDFRIDLEWREKELEKKLAEMGSDEYKLTPYDPEKARAVFAEALAVREMRDRRAKGEKPGPVDLRTRMQELGKDGAVARMAATLPGDASFRALLAQRPEKNASRLPAVTEALEKARQNFAKGRQLSECYMEQRENARKLAGGVGGEKLTPQQAARLAANLIAVRELETAAGGKDAPVDEKRLEQRIRELEQEPVVVKTGEDLLSSRNQAFLKKMSARRQDPERFVAATLFSAFQKRHPDKVRLPAAGEPKQPPQEEIQPSGEVLEAEGGVPVL